MISLTSEKNLIDYSHGSGCGCKVSPAQLKDILQEQWVLPAQNLVVGNSGGDDAAAYRMPDGSLLLSTVDFFMPVVNDPFTFGKIAAVNALSDIYAMGGKPLFALAVMGWPVEPLGTAAAAEVMRGASEVAHQAGMLIAGGHTIDSKEPFFGLAVNGICSEADLKRNDTARAGDLLYLTKPIGTGVMATAFKRKLLSEEALQPAIDWMCTPNDAGLWLGKRPEVHALTDITGFGVLGHVLEMCGSDLGACLKVSAIPLLSDQVQTLNQNMVYADNTLRNWKSYQPLCSPADLQQILLLCDPQTSGGLAVAVQADAAESFEQTCREHSLPIWRIGHFTASQSPRIQWA